MRLATSALLALLAATSALMVVGLGSAAENAASACPGHRGCLTNRLPAPVTITNGRAGYRVATTGPARRSSVPRSPYPRDASWFPGTGTWYRIVRGRLVVGRGHRRLWRSRAKIVPDRLGLVAAGPAGVAFQHDHRLYVAPLDGAARPVAPRELPLGWTTGGLFTYSYPRRELLLRDISGAILKTIARRPHEYQYDPANKSVYFLSHGALMATHGTSTRHLASLSRLRLSTNVWVQPLAGGLVELLGNSRLAVVRPDGSLLASTSVRRLDRISSVLAIARRSGAVAFTGVTGPQQHPNAENVYVLRPGADAAVVVHHQQGSFDVCAEGASIDWHASWLLYSNNLGDVAAIDTTGAHPTIKLTGLAHRLLGAREGFDAHWSR
ncbi:MAG: hypothetical protein ACRDNJ_10175 [Solirubrobacteraceae bacterium]